MSYQYIHVHVYLSFEGICILAVPIFCTCSLLISTITHTTYMKLYLVPQLFITCAFNGIWQPVWAPRCHIFVPCTRIAWKGMRPRYLYAQYINDMILNEVNQYHTLHIHMYLTTIHLAWHLNIAAFNVWSKFTVTNWG